MQTALFFHFYLSPSSLFLTLTAQRRPIRSRAADSTTFHLTQTAPTTLFLFLGLSRDPLKRRRVACAKGSKRRDENANVAFFPSSFPFVRILTPNRLFFCSSTPTSRLRLRLADAKLVGVSRRRDSRLPTILAPARRFPLLFPSREETPPARP